MGQFSTDRDADVPCLICQEGNIFYLGNPANMSLPPVRGHVGGMCTPALPVCTVEKLENSAVCTPAQVDLQVGSLRQTLVNSAADFGQVNRAEQLEVRVGVAATPAPAPPPPPSFVADPADVARAGGEGGQQVPVGRYSSARMPGQMGSISAGQEMSAMDVIAELTQSDYAAGREAANEMPVTAIEVDPEFGPPPGGDGAKDMSTLSDAEAVWLSETVASYVKRVGGLAIGVGRLLSSAEHRAFLREMGFTKARFYTSGAGTRMVAFRGNNRLRSMIKGTTYGMGALNGKSVTILNSAFRTPAGNAVGAAQNLAKKGGVIGLIFVAAVDIATYYSKPEAEREFTDLLVDLGFNLTIAVISSIAGAVIAGAALAVAAISAPVIVFVAFGFLASMVVGWAISKVVDYTGLRDGLKEALRNSEASPSDAAYQGMMTAP